MSVAAAFAAAPGCAIDHGARGEDIDQINPPGCEEGSTAPGCMPTAECTDTPPESGASCEEELKHAELSDAVYREAGGAGAPNLARETLQLTRRAGEPLERDVLRVGVEMFCLGETVAVRLFTRLRKGGTVPVVKRALDRILRDEVFHRDFGWTLLEWLLETPMAGDFRRQLAAELPDMLARVRRGYGGIALDRHGAEKLVALGKNLLGSSRAWGVMPVHEYVEAVEETFSRDYAPRFAALGIDIG